METLKLTDSKGNTLKIGDRVVYCRSTSIGCSTYQDLSIGIIEGETKRKIKIYDESELDFDWKKIPNELMRRNYEFYTVKPVLDGHHLCNVERILKI